MSNKVYWKDAKGKSIDIMSMDLNYCRNILKMIITGKTQSGKSFDINKHLKPKTLNGWNDAEANAFTDCKELEQSLDIDHHEFESDLGFNYNDL